MEFYIKKNATLPLLKLQVVKDGRSDYNKFMDLIEVSSLFFSMIDIETGIPKITSRPAGFVEKTFLDPNAEPEYYIYYQFTNRDTSKVGRYEGQFMLRNSDGNLIIPIREKLYINIQDSFIADDLEYDNCYVSEFPCCVNPPPVQPTPPCPSCPVCPESPTPTITPTVTPTPTITPFPIEGLTLDLESEISEGSLIINYYLTSNIILPFDLTMSFTQVLGLITGGTLDITTSCTITSGYYSGSSSYFTTDYNINDLTGNWSFTGISTSPINIPLSAITENTIIIGVTPTPTPTPTITPTNTPTETPINTSTQTPTTTPTITPSLTPFDPCAQYIISESELYLMSEDNSFIISELNPCITPTPTKTPTSTPTPTNTITSTPSLTPTNTPTNTETPTNTPTNTVTPSITPTLTPNFDAIQAQLNSSLSNYNSAIDNDWVIITKEEYQAIANNVNGVTKIGNTDLQVDTRDTATGYDTTTFGTIDENTPLTIPTGYYVVGFVAESWNQNGQVQLGYTTTFHTGVPTYMGNSPNVIGGATMFYVRKKPNGVEGAPATQNLYPVLNFIAPAYPNAVLNTFGWQTPDGGTTWIQTNPSNQTAKIQILITNVASWPT